MTPVSSLSDLKGGQVWKQKAFPYCSCYIVYLGGDHFVRTSMPDRVGSIAMTADGDGPIYPAAELLALLVEKGYECAGQFVDSLQTHEPAEDGPDEPMVPVRESEIVTGGHVYQIGSKPGTLDAHVRPNCLVLRCEAGQGLPGRGPDEPMEFLFNDEDASLLVHVAMIAARHCTPKKA